MDPQNPKTIKDTSSSARARAVPASRLGRLGHLGIMTAGVAGSMAVNGVSQLSRGKRPKMRELLLTPGSLQRITDQLARMRGAAMKIGQLISMDSGEVLPPELAGIMARLREGADIMPPTQLKKVLNTRWPKGWLRDFKRFDVHPIASASIGQVHRAQLRDGRDLAIKVQYPGVARSIDADVANVGALIRMSGLVPQGFDLAPYLEEARRLLHEETDYLREGRELTAYRALLEGDERFVLPELQDDWTVPDILAMSFVEGESIETVQTLSSQVRDRVATELFDLALREVFVFGRMQSDPNFANYRYNAETGQIVLLDFGATREIDQGVADLYRGILRAGLRRDREGLAEGADKLGLFDEATATEHRESILRMMEMIFDALTETPSFDFAETDLPRRLNAEGMALHEAGFVPPPLPMDALYVQRKLGGTFLLAARLRARVRVGEMMAEYTV